MKKAKTAGAKSVETVQTPEFDDRSWLSHLEDATAYRNPDESPEVLKALWALADLKKPLTIWLPVTMFAHEWAQLAEVARGDDPVETDMRRMMAESLRILATTNRRLWIQALRAMDCYPPTDASYGDVE